jgi:low affinity Fe/Cu permease
MSTVDILNSVTQKFHIYFGLPVVILGVIGGIFNIIVFATLKTFRETTCAFYLTAVNIGQLLTTCLVRVLSEGFYTDLRKISWVCKFQIYMAAWCT